MGRQRFERKVDRTFDTKPDTVERVEVITGVGRRRRWPADVKAQIIMESLEKGAMVSEVARRHGLRPQPVWARLNHRVPQLPRRRSDALAEQAAARNGKHWGNDSLASSVDR